MNNHTLSENAHDLNSLHPNCTSAHHSTAYINLQPVAYSAAFLTEQQTSGTYA